ncbi:hypothetical protein CH330_08770 [candidate division WOR-3 bacterium JGI_Cruoil_03_51_56]|uniref:MotA/TolQ/ExbB proton channel domain-containing protein n=1 Tax=candidate division WOR-3 bacterium JGI_Cruoil_03_51_56 TaxID=1973747 RepID=A0A235BRP0_UNCW3|nr:MAG: hypothetical protein CH330_08770 [candidate division WOR-3 bacterium JGI_Cruoil_03_51_56]
MVGTPQPSGGFLGPVLNAGLFAQIVILVLLAGSILSWAVIIRKLRMFSRARKQTRQFLGLFRHRARLEDYETIARDLNESPLSSLLLAGVKEWNSVHQYMHQATRAGLIQQLIPNVGEAMERAASREMDRLEAWLSYLAITASVAPFLGLLGTVQGVLRSFMAIRGEEFVTLQNIAPGISDALITTVIGLLVAIPAAIFYNHFVAKVRDLSSEMERFTSELTGIFRRQTVFPEDDSVQITKEI